MLSGEYKHNIDAKNRMFLPVKLREQLGETVVMIKSIDKCISVYPMQAWNSFTEKLEALPEIQARKVKRFIYSSAVDTQPDSQGRVLIPQNLKEYAELESSAIVIGNGDHCEIWNEALYNAEMESADTEDMAQTLIALGF